MKTKPIVFLLFTAFLFIACGVQPDKDLKKSVQAIIANCELNLRYASMKNCKNNEKKKFDSLRKSKGSVATLKTLSVLLNEDDLKTKSIAAGLMFSVKHYMSDIVKNPELIEDKVVKSFLKGLKNFTHAQASYAAQMVAELATLKNMESDLYEVLDGHPDENTRNSAYRSLMKHARLKNFSKVKELATTVNPKYTRGAALAAASYMKKYTDEEKKTICPWAQGFIDDQVYTVRLYAAQVLVLNCHGEYVDTVLDKAEKLAKEKKLKGSAISASITIFNFHCKDGYGRKATGTPEQCKRKDKLLKVIQRKK